MKVDSFPFNLGCSDSEMTKLVLTQIDMHVQTFMAPYYKLFSQNEGFSYN